MTTPTDTQDQAPAAVPGPASRFGVAIIAGTLLVDQATKWIAEAVLEPQTAVTLLPILQLYFTTNTGIAFSFLRGSDSQFLLYAVIAITILVIVFWARSRDGGRLAAAGFGLIVGGAIGNIVDRILYGHVIDFLLLHVGDRVLFVFNLADFALTLGPLLLIIAYLRVPRRT